MLIQPLPTHSTPSSTNHLTAFLLHLFHAQNTDFSQEKVNKQFSELGLKPEEVISKVGDAC